MIFKIRGDFYPRTKTLPFKQVLLFHGTGEIIHSLKDYATFTQQHKFIWIIRYKQELGVIDPKRRVVQSYQG